MRTGVAIQTSNYDWDNVQKAESNCMKTLAWTLKFIVFPLLPFLSGTFMRCLYAGSFEVASLSPAELAFSMALLMMVISVNTSRIENSTLRNAITPLFQLGLILYLILFSCVLFLQIDLNATQTTILHTVQEKVTNGLPVLPADFLNQNAKHELILGRLRWFTVIISIIVIPLAIYTNKKYDLEKL
ncbi:MAG: hypothetical protein ABIG30_01520 [Candidatus Aenigmatarchaeota archaeon]